jgi:uncharacterized protein
VPKRTWWRFGSIITALALLFAGLAANYSKRYELPWPALLGVYLCFVTQLAQAIAPGLASSREAARRVRPLWLLPVFWCLPYFFYAAGTGDWRWAALAKLLAVGIPGAAIYILFPIRSVARFNWQDAALALLLTAAVLSRQLHGIWNVPINLDFLVRLYLISVAAWTWTFIRPVPSLGFEFRLSRSILKAAAINFVLFAVIAIPLGFWLRFTGWNPRWQGPGAFCLNYLEIFLFIALLEETFFRGFLQTLLSGSFGSWWKAQALVSCLFGLFHILHAPFPNWRYVLLATIAGWFYGSAFRQSGSLIASSLVHAMVDTVWRTFLTVP